MPKNRMVEKEKVAVYADVLYDSAKKAGGRDAVVDLSEELQQVAHISRGNAELEETLCDRTLDDAKRADIARNVFAGCSPALTDALVVMTERGDFDLLNRVSNVFAKMVAEREQVTVVDVTTVVELDDHLRQVITDKAAADFGTDVILREHIDKSMLGGVLLSANGKRLNASLRWQLENARIALKKTV